MLVDKAKELMRPQFVMITITEAYAYPVFTTIGRANTSPLWLTLPSLHQAPDELGAGRGGSP